MSKKEEEKRVEESVIIQIKHQFDF